jgi:phosphoserine aminotransferase
METRVHNFNPGPAALPLPVLKTVQAELLNFQGTGMSILEISHRSSAFIKVVYDTVARVKRLMKLPENMHVIFLQGGASLQFAMVPMNLLKGGEFADYINTGTWSTNAIKEAKILTPNIRVIASSEDREFRYIPKDIRVNADAAYVYLTSNNTIKGTQWSSFPNTGGIPLVADMSSDILSRPFDPAPFGLIFAGAQKNLGPAGVTLVIVRKDMLERIPATLPKIFSYKTHVDQNSSYNTPPCFAIYVVQHFLKWLEEEVGGVEPMARVNDQKAALLYGLMDRTDFYRPTADKDSRSKMNVTFRLRTEDLEKKFLAEAKAAGLEGLPGHRSVGGCRASIYNAVPMESVKALADFMEKFARANG